MTLSQQLVSFMYGGSFHLFKPDVPADHDDYEVQILMNHYQYFGPFPLSYQDLAGQDCLAALTWIVRNCPQETLRPFRLTAEREICIQNRDFICRIIKLDPRDRTSANELLEDN